MKIMLDCSPQKLADCTKKYNYEFWQLRTPARYNNLAGVPYGIDNGCYVGFREKEFFKLVDEVRDGEHQIDFIRPKFVCAPDIVGDATRTLDLYDYFKRKLIGLPVCLVLQDGIGNHRIPWDELSAVFVGGSDTFKTSTEAMNACKVARMLGKWVHVGRVNSEARARWWKDMADSCDGSGVTRWADTKYDTHISAVLHALSNEDLQHKIEMGNFYQPGTGPKIKE